MKYRYRIAGDYDRAKQYFSKLLTARRKDPRAIGELVRVYIQTEEYDKAFEMARDNYLHKPSNPINLNNYFTCLIYRERTSDSRNELETVLGKLALDMSDRAQEMLRSAKARIYAYYDNDYSKAYAEIEEAIAMYPQTDYPLLTKADLATHAKDIDKLHEAISELERKVSKNSQSYRSYLRYKAYLRAMEGDVHGAKKFVEKELSGMGEAALDRLLGKLDEIGKALTMP